MTQQSYRSKRSYFLLRNRLFASNWEVCFGSKAEKLNASICFPLCARNQTLLDEVGMFDKCKEQTIKNKN